MRRFPHSRLAPKWFEELLNADGLTYRIACRKAKLCPCQDPRGSGPDPHCPLCGGLGYTWSDPPMREHEAELLLPPSREAGESHMAGPLGKLPHAWAELISVEGPTGPVAGARLVDGYLEVPEGYPRPGIYRVRYRAPEQGRGHIQDMRLEREWAERGEVQTGDLSLTLPRQGPDGPNPCWEVAPHDQVVVLDHRLWTQQRMIRGAKETLTHPWVLEVREARAVQGGVEVVYAPGVDFVLEAGRVRWLEGRGPALRTPYVLDYVAAPTYYVLGDLGHRRHVEGWDLPRRVALRLFDVYPGRGR